MATTAIKGNLTIIGLNTDAPTIFWNGVEVLGVIGINVAWEKGERQIKLKVNGTADSMYMEMVSAGISVKKGR